MRVLIVSQYYDPEPVPLPGSLARELAARGHSVRVVTGLPNYPSGQLYDGYGRRRYNRQRLGSIDILRVPLYPDHSQRAARRILNYASFAAGSSVARSFARSADVIYVYATQMTAAFGPWWWRLTGGSPYVLHIQDLWPDSIVGSSLAGEGRLADMADRLLTPWLRTVYRNSSAVVGIAPTMVKTLVERGVAATKVKQVYNWSPDDDSLASAPDVRDGYRPGNSTRFIYAGNVGDLQDLETVVRAAHVSRNAGVEVLILGDGVALPRVKALAERLGADNVRFSGRVPRESVAGFYMSSHFGLVTLKDLPVFRGTIPSKFQSLLARGLPVVSNVQGDVRSFVEHEGVGFVADAEDAGSLAEALFRAASLSAESREALARRARSVYEERFSLSAGVDALERILLDVATK